MKLLVLHAFACFFFVEDAGLSDDVLKAFAESEGNLEGSRLKRLLQDVRAMNSFGHSALHVSCDLENIGIAKLLLQGTRLSEGKQAALALLLDQDPAGRIALEHCFDKGPAKANLAGFLLCFEKEQKTPHPKGRQLAQRRSKGRNVFLEAMEQAEESVALLCLQHAVPDEYESTDNDEKNTAVHIAVKRNFLTVVTELVEKYNADVDTPNFDGYYPLAFAVSQSHLKIMRFLLDHSRMKVDHAIGPFGESALHIAAENGVVAVMTELVEKRKADVNVKNAGGETPLFRAVLLSRLDAVDYLLGCPGINLDRDNLDREKNALLHLAAQSGLVTLMATFVASHGADVNAVNIRSETPLFLALQRKRLDAADFLLGCPGIHPDEQSVLIFSALRQAFEAREGDLASTLEHVWGGRYQHLAAMILNSPTAGTENTSSPLPPLTPQAPPAQQGLVHWKTSLVMSVVAVVVACFIAFWFR